MDRARRHPIVRQQLQIFGIEAALFRALSCWFGPRLWVAAVVLSVWWIWGMCPSFTRALCSPSRIAKSDFDCTTRPHSQFEYGSTLWITRCSNGSP